MLLSYNELMKRGPSLFTPFNPANVNASSIDLTLGRKLLVESPCCEVVDYRKREGYIQEAVEMGDSGFVLRPGQFVLAQSVEVFNLPPNVSGEYKLKSSMARIGLEHLNAGWCDAGWNGSVLTLELKNMNTYHSILIRPGDLIGQIVFLEHEAVPKEGLYSTKGRYNGDKEVKAAKA